MAIRVLRELEHAGITCCVLRGGDRLREYEDEHEIDLLIAEHQLGALCNILRALGFVRLRIWGHAPHHFFVAYDEPGDRWLKLDVVTRVAYGRPTHELVTELADRCLKKRQRIGSIYVPSPEDELITLLLHCVVDKGNFPPHWQQRIADLIQHVTICFAN
jgi:hypothetical protein